MKNIKSITPKVTQEELIKWLQKNAGKWAGIGATDGLISLFHHETGETIAVVETDVHLSDDKVTVKFEGKQKEDASEWLFTDIIDGGLDQIIEGRLTAAGFNIEYADWDIYERVQIFKAT